MVFVWVQGHGNLQILSTNCLHWNHFPCNNAMLLLIHHLMADRQFIFLWFGMIPIKRNSTLSMMSTSQCRIRHCVFSLTSLIFAEAYFVISLLSSSWRSTSILLWGRDQGHQSPSVRRPKWAKTYSEIWETLFIVSYNYYFISSSLDWFVVCG